MKYYFLIGYLPELQRDDAKIRFGIADLLSEKFHMAERDWKEINLILLERDIFIIEKMLSGKTARIDHSVYGADFWQDQVHARSEGPKFILDFLNQIEGTNFGYRETDRLYGEYYDYVAANTANALVKRYIEHERALRNILAAHRARTKGLDVSGFVVGENDIVEMLRRSNADDFGLSGEYPWVESLLTAEHPPVRQELIEQILWDYLDEHAGNDPFHFNSILSYVIKAQMLEKKLALSEEEGMNKVRRLEGR